MLIFANTYVWLSLTKFVPYVNYDLYAWVCAVFLNMLYKHMIRDWIEQGKLPLLYNRYIYLQYKPIFQDIWSTISFPTKKYMFNSVVIMSLHDTVALVYKHLSEMLYTGEDN